MKFADEGGAIIEAPGRPAVDVDKLGVWKAFKDLREALRRCGIGQEYGPLPVVFALEHDAYNQLRDRMVASDEFSAMFFMRRRRKKINPGDGRTMIAGIAVVRGDRPNEVRGDGGCLYCDADQGEAHRAGCARLSTDPF